jgi:hypothetical protein
MPPSPIFGVKNRFCVYSILSCDKIVLKGRNSGIFDINLVNIFLNSMIGLGDGIVAAEIIRTLRVFFEG